MTSRIARIAFGTLPRHDAQFAEACVPGLPVVSQRRAPSFVSYLRQKLLSDEQLAAQLQTGHADALTVLFERHSPRLFSIARRILRNDAEAEDTVQTIFIDAYRSIHQFDPEKGEFKTWLLLFAYQRAFNGRRHLNASRFFSTEPLDVLDKFLPEVLGVGERKAAYSHGESRILIQQVMRSLEPRQQRTIELVYYQGLTAEEVAVQTGETVRVVRHNLYRGLEKLRRVLFDGEPKFKGKGGPR